MPPFKFPKTTAARRNHAAIIDMVAMATSRVLQLDAPARRRPDALPGH